MMTWNLVFVLSILASFFAGGLYEGWRGGIALPVFFAAMLLLSLAGFGLGLGLKSIFSMWG